MRITKLLPYSFLLLSLTSAAQNKNVYEPSMDVQHYDFTLEVSDDNDELKGIATTTVKFMQEVGEISFDLTAKNESGKGMEVTGVKENGQPSQFIHNVLRLKILLHKLSTAGETRIFEISYHGIPTDGLVFSRNKFKQRTIFGDNWPNRAHNWLPCVDHLSDKASVDFKVTAPEHYKVISNGILIEETTLEGHLKFTHWQETVALPTKVMVIGLADFAVNYAGNVDCIPVSSWVFPADKKNGFYDYAQALDILPFFIKYIGPYAYKKLANVEAITIFGGMENASAIFYNEESIKGTPGSSDGLMAHEIAHQWFGNSATESGWQHVWLSEGFATEMSHLYLEHKYGKDTLIAMMKADRHDVIAFSKQRHTPIVDTSEKKNFLILLNTNSYRKGGWVLHMLRNRLGDSLFQKTIATYYTTFAGKNASTDELRQITEQVSKKDLKTFFQQWLYTAGNPILDIDWKYDGKKKEVLVNLTQTQPTLFTFPLEISFDNSRSFSTILVSDKETQAKFPMWSKPLKLVADPNTNLLFEGTVTELK